jgi:hypothetical protein
LQAVTTRKHKIQEDKIKFFGVDAKESVLAGWRHKNLEVLLFEPFP